uniref:NADH-ubiquinone oxidoreductase chain 6 n=1 Tax=Coleoptera sp. 21 KM-2017 TaxID=2219325 RepID=A0A346RHA1_9COLE|nr:NADH dehydrogenase subunit 6 [Coleoptera sp. 21 KM-2017]
MLTMHLITILLSIMFISMNHPLTMGLTLILQSINIAIITGLTNLSFWFSYIIFLIMVGGMLILFMYMTSVASNEKFKFNLKIILISIKFMIIISIMMLYNNHLENMFNMNQMTNEIFYNSINLNINKYFNLPFSNIMILMIIYLLITMIASVKITKFEKGPLRQKF